MFDILLCKIGGFMNELTVSGKKTIAACFSSFDGGGDFF